MKSDARLGESAPSTRSPSIGVDLSSAGEVAGKAIGVEAVLMDPNLGEATDNDWYAAPRRPDR
jgi:hypothetical protein